MNEQRRFTADASHDLRTPLAIMRSELDVALRSTTTPPEAIAPLSSVNEEVVRMQRIVEDLLTLARLDDAPTTWNAQTVDLAALMRNVHERMSTAAAPRTFVLHCPEQPIGVWGEEARLDQLIANLIENAIKYTPEFGRIQLRLTSIGDRAVLSVSDTGQGIDPESVPHVFDRFFREDKARSHGGTGLGLAICQAVAKNHNGSIEVESQPGVGSTFTVTLPLETNL